MKHLKIALFVLLGFLVVNPVEAKVQHQVHKVYHHISHHQVYHKVVKHHKVHKIQYHKVQHQKLTKVQQQTLANNYDSSGAYYTKENNDHPPAFGTLHGNLIAKAESLMGFTARQLGLPPNFWCAYFLNKLTHSGNDGTAKSYLHRGTPAKAGCVGCVAITSRKGGGHVGIVEGYDPHGNPILISGNHGRKVGRGVYAKKSVLGYRYV